MLLELCVTELEDVATDSQSGRLSSQPVVVESSHPYTDDTSSSGTVKIPGIVGGGEAGAAGLASAASAASAAASGEQLAPSDRAEFTVALDTLLPTFPKIGLSLFKIKHGRKPGIVDVS